MHPQSDKKVHFLATNLKWTKNGGFIGGLRGGWGSKSPKVHILGVLHPPKINLEYWPDSCVTSVSWICATRMCQIVASWLIGFVFGLLVDPISVYPHHECTLVLPLPMGKGIWKVWMVYVYHWIMSGLFVWSLATGAQGPRSFFSSYC